MTIELPSSDWRLRFGNIPVKLVERNGTFEHENSTASERYIIKADDLEAFVALAFPDPITVNGYSQPLATKALPGFPALHLKRLRWSSHVDGVPVDPFASDATAPDGTYCGDVIIDLEYGVTPYNSGDPSGNDPSTFLEISATGAGEFINAPVRGTSQWVTLDADEEADVKEANVPHPVSQPLVEWTCRWNQVPADFFTNTYIGILRDKLGKVNSTTMRLFEKAPQASILFTGWSASKQFTWRNGFVGTPPIKLEFKFLEKNFISDEGVVVTHQHMYRPGRGYRRLLINNNRVYAETNLNLLFEPS